MRRRRNWVERVEIRNVEKIWAGRRTVDGAGVKLLRIFSNAEAHILDPFLLLDNFGSDNPDDYIAGFPWHPHRGIETVTYMMNGLVEHADSLGNAGSIRTGEVQWMTAGSGIIHQEMPKKTPGRSMGFQLWVNLPAKQKMCAPKYRDVKAADIPVVEIAKGVKAKVICGKAGSESGPVHDLAVDVEYLDVEMQPKSEMVRKAKSSHTAFAYVYEGKGYFGAGSAPAGEGQLLLFGKGEAVSAKAADGAVLKFILATGEPLREGIAWGGPIVMNTEAELQQAFQELSAGTFIKHRKK